MTSGDQPIFSWCPSFHLAFQNATECLAHHVQQFSNEPEEHEQAVISYFYRLQPFLSLFLTLSLTSTHLTLITYASTVPKTNNVRHSIKQPDRIRRL